MSVSYLPASFSACFAKAGESQLIIWDQDKNQCFAPEDKKIAMQRTVAANGKMGKRFFVIRNVKGGREKIYSFFPDLSPWSIDQNFRVDKEAPYRVFNRKIFEEKPHLFIFGNRAAFYNKDEKEWNSLALQEDKPVELPWMGFNLTLLEHFEDKVPVYLPVYTTPVQKNNKIIRGKDRALQVQVEDSKYWITRESPLSLMLKGERVILQLVKSSIRLPFEFCFDQIQDG